MKYEYRCPHCRATQLSTVRDDRLEILCKSCDLFVVATRVFSFSVAIPFTEHFNASAGKHISSRAQHADILKAASEVETLKSGVEHKFVPVDPADAKAVYGIKDDMLESVREDKAKSDMALGQTIGDVQKTKTFVI